jgi:hypothetical protein
MSASARLRQYLEPCDPPSLWFQRLLHVSTRLASFFS